MKAFFKDNRGVTLVELMVAVVVFSIITIPLLHSFRTATMTVVKSERMGRISMAAQNVMERVESAKIRDIVDDEDAAKTALSAETVTYYEKNGAGYSIRTNAGSMPYCIWLEGISSGEKKYNAMVEITPNSAINNKELSVFTPMNIVYSQPIGDDENNPDKEAEDREIGNKKIETREIVIDVTKAETILNVKIKYTYEYGYENIWGPGFGHGGGHGGTYSYDGYSASYEIVAGERPTVYVIYTPMFGIEDNIIINNADNADFDLFIIKRDVDPEGEHYKCTVNQVGMPANIYTNVNEGIGIVQIEYCLNDVTVGGAPANVHDYLVLKESKERAYNITVKIYPYDSDFNSESLLELEGMTID